MAFPLITGLIRGIGRALLLLFSITVAEIGGLYYYLRNYRADAYDRLLDGGLTGSDLLGVLLNTDVVLVMIGLAVLGVVVEHLARTTTSRGAGG